MESDSASIMGQLILILLLTGTNAFFASAEMAIVSVNKSKIRRLSEEGNSKARLLERFIDEPSRFLSTIQIGITLAGFFSSASAATGLSSHVAKWMQQLGIPFSGEIAMIGVTLMLSYFTLVFGELVPKRIALKKSETIALSSVKTIYLVSLIAKPFIKILSLSTLFVLKVTGNSQDNAEEKISEEEIRALVSQSKQDGCIEDEEEVMIDKVFEFNDRIVKEIMTPRKDIFVINIQEDIEVILDKITEFNYSRIPVYEDNIDHIIGLLYTKDLIKEARKVGFHAINIRNILRTPYFIPESKKINELFKNFKESKNHIAILIDEYGGFSGIVTMEDLVEEVMGDIDDEYDIEKLKIEQMDEKTYLVNGSTGIHDLKYTLGLELPEGEYDTLNGFLTTYMGAIPDEGVEVALEDIKYTIVSANRRRIEQVQVVLPFNSK
ncbi:hemolysin family protein [Niameybacter massiliensis]|uniref:hemolysin family protein n=1 Tax=Niameybacter massiliensis TaxID=1658108 RepID=UPI0006B49D5A|nr:hemolysin family protein [Niameybacter massiliensis]